MKKNTLQSGYVTPAIEIVIAESQKVICASLTGNTEDFENDSEFEW